MKLEGISGFRIVVEMVNLENQKFYGNMKLSAQIKYISGVLIRSNFD